MLPLQKNKRISVLIDFSDIFDFIKNITNTNIDVFSISKYIEYSIYLLLVFEETNDCYNGVSIIEAVNGVNNYADIWFSDNYNRVSELDDLILKNIVDKVTVFYSGEIIDSLVSIEKKKDFVYLFNYHFGVIK